MKPIFFPTAADFRRWLEQHHATATELWIGFNKKGSGLGGMSYLEAVDEALCFGWIDGLLKRIDDQRHQQRYTPRRPGSIWSNINVKKIERLTAAGKMHPAGLAAFAARTAAKTGIYSFEAAKPKAFSVAAEKEFRAHKKAWTFFSAQPPGYRRLMAFWVMNAKQEATRSRRLQRLIAASAAGKRIT